MRTRGPGLQIAICPPLGAFQPGEVRVVALPWSVGLGRDVHIMRRHVGCTCLRLEGLPEHLHAGTSGTLRLQVRAPMRPGPFHARIRLILDTPLLAPLPAPLRARGLESGLASPRSPGAARAKASHEPLPGDGTLDREVSGYVGSPAVVRPALLVLRRQPVGCAVDRRLGVVVMRPGIDRGSGVPQKTCSKDQQIETRLEGVAGHVEVAPPLAGASAAGGASIRVRLRMPEQPGRLQAVLHVRIPGHGWRRVPIRATVVEASTPLDRSD